VRVHTLESQLALPLPRQRVFDFFADAGNLQRITPPWLQFLILTPPPIELRAGARIEYRLRLHGLPLRWCTRIEVWDPPRRFVDCQLRGPYALWEHEHVFTDGTEGTEVADRVRYALPLGPLGGLAHGFVRRDLRAIFAYRRAALRECLLGTRPSAGAPDSL
jgi:ligand-binding SRPBCC domain-containing protein